MSDQTISLEAIAGPAISDVARADQATTPSARDRAKEAMDWAVFSLGVLSLTIAIGATLVTHLGGYEQATFDPTVEISVSVLPEVL